MKNIEYEERVMINKNDYERVISDVKRSKKEYRLLRITNTYLDNDEKAMRTNKQVLRIRKTNFNNEELTFKYRNNDGSNTEINESLKSHPQIDAALDNKFKDFHPIAKLKTKRMEVQYDNYLLVIDKNSYHGVVDYNLEIEAENQEEAEKIIKFYCEKYGFEYKRDYEVKSKRAIDLADSKRKKR